MPGFGSGPFGGGGGENFGEYNWSKASLYSTAPEPHLLEDEAQGGLFLKYSQAQGEVFDILRKKIRDFGDLRDPLLVRTQYDEIETLVLGKRVDPVEAIEQSGIEGSVAANTQFSAVRARFKAEDVGKLLKIENSSIAGNNNVVKIAVVLSSTTVSTEPALVQDAGPLRWSLRAETVSETITFEVASGDVSRIYPGWFLTDGFNDLKVSGRRQFALDGTHTQQTEKEGVDGTIASGVLTSNTAVFTQENVGKRVTLSGSVFPENNTKTEITAVLNSTSVELADPGLLDESTPLTWAVLKRATITLASNAALTGYVLQSGANGSTTAPDTIVTPSARHTSDDVGRLITILSDGSANNGTYEITSVIDSSTVQVTPSTLLTESGPFLWEVRQPTGLADTRSVEVYAHSLLQYLAQDFGISLDRRDTEDFQRKWVSSVPRWMNRKGQEEIYKYLARLTGFEVEVTRLYRVSLETLAENPTLVNLDIVGEDAEGRFGFGDGTLTLVSGVVHFSSTSAIFNPGDVGRQVEISGSAGGLNDGLRTIDTFVSATEVMFRIIDTMSGTSEVGLDWRIVRLYTTKVPGRPVMDEINEDLMKFLKAPISIQSGTDGSLSSTNRLTAPSAVFTELYVQHQVVISGSGSGNDGTYLVDAFISSTELQLDATLTTPDANNGSVSWDIQEFPFTIDKSCYEDNFSTLLGAGDGHIEIISSDPPSASAFPVTYAVLVKGDIDVATGVGQGQWKFTDSAGNSFFLTSAPIETPDLGVSGSDGSILAGTPVVFEDTVLSTFTPSDVNRKIKITNSVSGNNGVHSIVSYISATQVGLRSDGPQVVPDPSNGSLEWEFVDYTIEIEATTPPATGLGTLEYICPNSESCGFCASNKLLVEGTTSLPLEDPLERLFDRLNEGKPHHVEFVSKAGLSGGGAVVIAGSGVRY
jgi:hypothetical protein